jgi:hypothetical protein
MLGDKKADFCPGWKPDTSRQRCHWRQGSTWNESISAEPLPKAVGMEIR